MCVFVWRDTCVFGAPLIHTALCAGSNMFRPEKCHTVHGTCYHPEIWRHEGPVFVPQCASGPVKWLHIVSVGDYTSMESSYQTSWVLQQNYPYYYRSSKFAAPSSRLRALVQYMSRVQMGDWLEISALRYNIVEYTVVVVDTCSERCRFSSVVTELFS